MIVLHIDSSPRGVDSVSRCLTGQIVDRLKTVEPTLDVVRYDLGDRPLPHLSSDAIGALRRAELATAEQREVGALSDRMIDELKRADLIVIGSPMHNFGISSHLKAWFDTIIRAGKTFSYSDKGPEGLLKGKRAIVVETRGGVRDLAHSRHGRIGIDRDSRRGKDGLRLLASFRRFSFC